MKYNTNFDDNHNQSQISHESNVSLRTQYTRRSSKQQQHQHQQPPHQNETYTTSHFNNEHNYPYPYNTESTSQYNATQFTRHKATNPFPQPDSRRIFDPSLQDDETDTNNNKHQYTLPIDTWNSFMSKTSNEESICGTKQRISKSKNFQSNIFSPLNNSTTPYNDPNQRRLIKGTDNSQYSTTTQIVGLPGGVKRGQYDIKDDKKFYNKQNIGYLYKMQREYNDAFTSEVNKDDQVDKEFPTDQRSGSTFHNKNRSQILGNEDNINNDNNLNKGKKRPIGACNYFQSQIQFS